MKISTFMDLVTNEEGLSKSTDRAQVGEVLRIANEKTDGILYSVVKLMQEPRQRKAKGDE